MNYSLFVYIIYYYWSCNEKQILVLFQTTVIWLHAYLLCLTLSIAKYVIESWVGIGSTSDYIAPLDVKNYEEYLKQKHEWSILGDIYPSG